jgi:amicyanin
MYRALFAIALAIAVGTTCLHAEPPATQPATQPAAQVSIDNFSFAPAELTVHVGDTVTWTNHDDMPHTVVSIKPDRTLHSPSIDTDERFSFTFTKAGTYEYLCSIHPHMRGRVVVK